MRQHLFLFAITTLVLSSCALNKIFLVPAELSTDDSFSRYIEDYDDTLTLSFDPKTNPVITHSDGRLVDAPFTLESVYFENSRGAQINAWLMKPDNYNGTTIYFLHGNAAHIPYQYGLATPFAEVGYQVLMIDYSGFGFSEGKATRKNVLADANEGLDYLLAREDIEYEHLLIYGQSLGGHLAAVVATQNQDKIDAVIIEGAFSSHKTIANERVPLLGKIFTKEMYSGQDSLANFHKPVLIIHSTEDTTIPLSHGRTLFEAANEPKMIYVIDKPHVRGPLFYRDSIVARMDLLVE